MSTLLEQMARRIAELERLTKRLATGEIYHATDPVIAGQIRQGTYSKRAVFSKALVDNVATAVFTITTTNETGDNDSGTWACFMRSLIQDNVAPAGANAAAKAHEATFCRAMGGAAGVNSAVSEVAETASAATAGAVRDIGTVTVSTSETGEYQVNVAILADHTGTGAAALVAVCEVTLIWYGFTTPPVLAAA